MRASFARRRDSGLRVLGFVDDFLPRGTPVSDGLSVLGHPGVLPGLVSELVVAEIVVVPGAMAWESFQQILEQMSMDGGPRIRLSPGYYDLLSTTPRVAHRNFVPLFVVDSARLNGFDAFLKIGPGFRPGRPAARAAAAAGEPDPAGGAAWGRARSLCTSNTWASAAGRSMPGCLPRAPGGWLAATGLNRLPLLWAVLAGKMSLVGPRPIPVAARGQHRRWLPSLASVKPGITGPWAVVPVAALEEEMRAALYYIRNWTIWLDVQVLAQTVLVTLRRRWGLLD